MTSGTIGDATAHLDRDYIGWQPVVAGALVAVAIFTTLTVFGSAVGLSLISADPSHGVSGQLAAIAAGIWTAWVAVIAFAAGGYIAGRLRHKIAGATLDETKMRDGLHGAVCWAIAAILSSVLLAGSVGAPAAAAMKDAAATGLNARVTELFQGEHLPGNPAVRSDAASILKLISGHTGLTDTQRGLLSQMVVGQTGISPADANGRVTAAVNSVREAADGARRGSVLAAFLAAAALAIGAAAAWAAAVAGGTHRDGGQAFSPMTRWK